MVRKVYTGGTFDLFHAGHVNFLRQCWYIAGNYYNFYGTDVLNNTVTVSLNTDEFVEKFKGKPPIYTYKERRELLAACKWVYDIIPNTGDSDSKPAIEKVKPDFIVVGSDWAKKDYYTQMGFTQEWLDKKKIILIYVPYTEGVSTSDLKERLLKS